MSWNISHLKKIEGAPVIRGTVPNTENNEEERERPSTVNYFWQEPATVLGQVGWLDRGGGWHLLQAHVSWSAPWRPISVLHLMGL